MKQNALLLLAVCALALAGCSSAPTHVDKGTIRAKTFSFVNPGPREASPARTKLQPVNKMIQDAIAKNLASRGLTRTESGGDLTVAYLIVVGNNVTTEMLADYYGYGSDASALLDKASSAYTDSAHRNYFEAGTLVIDIVDARTHKLLKRNYASRELLRNPSESAREALIQETVDAILSDLRVAAP
jgi:hypothetical protein